VVRPRFDPATEVSFGWCGELVDLLESNGVQVIDLQADDATREIVEASIQSEDPWLVVFYDHGDEHGLVEQGGKGYVIDKRNDDLLAGREIYTLACSWGRDGGVDAWRKGARAVWCYVREFGFTSEALEEFKMFANSGLRFRLEGRTWEECLRLAKELAEDLCRKLVGEGKYISAVILQDDADALRCYTDGNPPDTSGCPVRRLLIKLLGPEKAWRIGRIQALGWILFLTGYGVALHDYAHALWEVGGYREILSLQGGYIGFAMVFAGFILLVSEHIAFGEKKQKDDYGSRREDEQHREQHEHAGEHGVD
jgi:hypothetical protein